MNLCACMGVRDGDEYCYCEMKRRGLDTSHYEWSSEEIEEFKKALSVMFEWNEENK